MWYDLAIYSLKVGVCLAVFYLFFKLLLSRETFHRFNRIVLLGGIVLSFVLPLCIITVYRTLPALPVSALPVVSAAADLPTEDQAFPWERLLGGIFAVGVAGAFVRLCWSLGSVVRLICRCGRRERLDDGTVLVYAGDSVRPFSWGRYIVLPECDRAACGEAILLHEQAHVRMHHSADLLLTDLCGCLQWFNPAMWLLRRELRDIHEYEADEAVISSGIDAKSYQLLLIRKAAGGRWYSIANSFNHSKLKNRITMMLRKKSSRWTEARVLLLLPLTALALGAFAETVYLFPEDKGKKENPKIHAPTPDGADPMLLVDGREQLASSIKGVIPERIQPITEQKELQHELEDYFKSDEWQDALRKMEVSGEYFKSDEWQDALRKMEASGEYFKSDEWQDALRTMEASGEYFKSDEWQDARLRLEDMGKLSSRLDPEKIRRMEPLAGKNAVRRNGEQASGGVEEIKRHE